VSEEPTSDGTDFGPLLGGGAGLQKVAATASSGFALQNGTPTILQWTAPSDGNKHRAMVFIAIDVTAATTGGEIDMTTVLNGDSDTGVTVINGTRGTGLSQGMSVQKDGTGIMVIVDPGSTITIFQGTAMTAGAALLWAEIWGS
jgi:hypothetical protein